MKDDISDECAERMILEGTKYTGRGYEILVMRSAQSGQTLISIVTQDGMLESKDVIIGLNGVEVYGVRPPTHGSYYEG